MFNSILGIIKGLFVALGWIKQRSDQATGAELQRGKDSGDELVRITKAVNARLDPAASGGVRDEFDRDGSDTSGDKDPTRL